jgi:hypothetical protein
MFRFDDVRRLPAAQRHHYDRIRDAFAALLLVLRNGPELPKTQDEAFCERLAAAVRGLWLALQDALGTEGQDPLDADWREQISNGWIEENALGHNAKQLAMTPRPDRDFVAAVLGDHSVWGRGKIGWTLIREEIEGFAAALLRALGPGGGDPLPDLPLDPERIPLGALTLPPELLEKLKRLSDAAGDCCEAVSASEDEARHWYRLLMGGRLPLPTPDPHEAELLRSWLRRLHPDLSPQSIERRVLQDLSEARRRDENYCWGPNWTFLNEVMAARCGVSKRQLDGMTWPEIAAALKAAYERESGAARSETEGAEPPQVDRDRLESAVDPQPPPLVEQDVMSSNPTTDAVRLLKLLLTPCPALWRLARNYDPPLDPSCPDAKQEEREYGAWQLIGRNTNNYTRDCLLEATQALSRLADALPPPVKALRAWGFFVRFGPLLDTIMVSLVDERSDKGQIAWRVQWTRIAQAIKDWAPEPDWPGMRAELKEFELRGGQLPPTVQTPPPNDSGAAPSGEQGKVNLPPEPPRYVNLSQAAAAVNKTKSCLEGYKRKKKDPIPDPDSPGGGGKADEWLWTTIRPWLERTFNRKLPELLANLNFRSGRS